MTPTDLRDAILDAAATTCRDDAGETKVRVFRSSFAVHACHYARDGRVRVFRTDRFSVLAGLTDEFLNDGVAQLAASSNDGFMAQIIVSNARDRRRAERASEAIVFVQPRLASSEVLVVDLDGLARFHRWERDAVVTGDGSGAIVPSRLGIVGDPEAP